MLFEHTYIHTYIHVPFYLSIGADCDVPPDSSISPLKTYEGVTVTVTCETGFHSSGVPQRRCLSTEKWDGPQPVCQSKYNTMK